METFSDKRNFFVKNGFVHFENTLSKALLKKLRCFSDKLEASAIADFQQGELKNQYSISTESGVPRLFRYNDILFESPELMFELLASPIIMTISKILGGDGCVPMQLDIIYKYPHPHPHVAWHQDAPHSRKCPYFNIGVYLDDANLNDGCLNFVPNTQHNILDIYKLASLHGWGIPGVVQQPAKAGDIVVHDMMILHSSKPKRSEGVRRTIYIELRPLAGIIDSAKQSQEWAELRKQWMAHVLIAAEPSSIPAGWNEFYGEPKYDVNTLVKRIKAKWEPPIPSIWSPKHVEHPNYPTPADLR